MLTALTLSLALTAAGAQSQPQARPIADYLQQSTWTLTAPAPAARSRGGDPVRNGAVIGAIVGGIVGGVGIGLLCHAVNDTGDPICWKAALLYAGIGAGAGAGIGAGVDALFGRRTTFTASVRF
jgi:hypothetical protein